MCHVRGDLAGAEVYAREGLALLEGQAGDITERTRAYLQEALCRALIGQGQTEGAEGLLRATIAIYETQHLASAACNGLIILGEVSRVAGRVGAADHAYQRAINSAQSLGLPTTHIGIASFNQGLVKLQQRAPGAAEAKFLLSRQHLTADDYPFFHALTWLGQASCVAMLGDWARWGAVMDLSDERFPAGTISDPDVLLLVALSREAAEAAGRTEEAARARALEVEHARRLGRTLAP